MKLAVGRRFESCPGHFLYFKMPSDFTNLRVWREAIDFCKEVYKVLESFPKFEENNIISQLRRASVSISTNIAEGCGKTFFKEEMVFFRIAQGSTKECMSLILLSKELGYLSNKKSEELFDQSELISKMLTLLLRNKREKFREVRKRLGSNFGKEKF